MLNKTLSYICCMFMLQKHATEFKAMKIWIPINMEIYHYL